VCIFPAADMEGSEGGGEKAQGNENKISDMF
jgi:hypothetical protein